MEGWLLIDVAHKGEVRLARVTPQEPRIDTVLRWDAAGLPTFTDALLRFERETGHRLNAQQVVIAIAGAAVGDTIPISRSRWNISRSGLATMLGRPVVILNEVAAQAWAAIDTPPLTTPIRGTGAPDLRVRGRHLLLTIDDGIGTAIIDVSDDHRATVLEAEGGHLDFTPESEVEQALCRAICPTGSGPTYEQVLIASRTDPATARILARLSEREWQDLRAGLLGRLAANLVLATGAWTGVMVRGHALPDFTPSARAAFEAGFTSRRSFRRLIGAARCWRVEQREPVLAGAAALLKHRHPTG